MSADNDEILTAFESANLHRFRPGQRQYDDATQAAWEGWQGAWNCRTPAPTAPTLTDDEIMDIAEPFHDLGDVAFDEVAFARELIARMNANQGGGS
jgi:hypothetical protein